MRALILLTVLMISTSGFAQRVKENVKQKTYVSGTTTTTTKKNTKAQPRERFDFSDKSTKKSKD